MDRRTFMKSAMAAGALTTGLPAAQAQPKPDGPVRHVVLFFTDDQSDHLACLGTAGVRTPHADALAEEGVLFNRAYSTCASCSPARGAILTGMYPHTNGHWRNTHTPVISEPRIEFTREGRVAQVEHVGVHEDIPTLVEVLNRAGYETGITQKFHLSPVWKFPFDQFIVQHLEPEDTYGAVKQFIEAAGDRPSFLMCNIGNTHRPFKRVDPEGTGIEPVDPDAIEVPGHLPDTPRMRRDLANYFDTVQVADACLGRGMDALREAGRLEDTLIIFSADQGYAYHRAKATAYDDGTHVPLIVSGPGIERGIESEQLVSHVDVMPTILDYLGVGIPETVQGRTLRPLLNGERPDDWRDIVFTEHNSHGPNIEREWYPIRSAYDGRLHYLWNLASERVSEKPMQAYIDEADPPEHAPPVPWTPQDCFPGGPWDNQSFVATVEAKDAFPLQFELLQQTFARPEEELYDHHSDPDELFNVASDPAYAEHRARLRKALEDWMDATRDAGYDLKDVPRREG